jgi:FtsH-binding integral membrane protein
MQFLIELSILVFILGNAAVFGGFFHQRNEKSKNITSGMYLGSLGAFAGYALAAILTKVKYSASPSKETWIVLVLLAIGAVVAFVKKDDRKSDPLTWWLAAIIAAATLAITFIWHIHS